MKKIKVNTLMKIQMASKMEIEDLENHNDNITINILMASIYLSRMLPSLGLQSVGKGSIKDSVVINAVSNVLVHTLMLCEACNYELPDEDDIKDFELGIPLNVQKDSIITVMGMIGAFTSILHIINVDLETIIWDDVDVPDDFEDCILTILGGISNLGKKHNFTLNDIFDNVIE